jgi:DNA polymerase-3 subunit delta'
MTMQDTYPWQTKQWHAIFTRWQNKKFPHALLLTGPQGLGKLAFAQNVAARLLCPTISHQQEFACGTCSSCELIKAETHPDLFTIQPESDSSVIKIEQIRELLLSLQQTAQQSSQQVVILEPAEAMNNAAANALLKMLEEPSGVVTFLLISHQPGTMPATIRSRCQKMNFPIPPVSTSLDWLKNQLPAEQNTELLLALSENIPLRAIAFAAASRFSAHKQLVDQFIQLSNHDLTPLKIAASCAEISAEQVYEGLCLVLMDIVRLQQFSDSVIAHTHQRDTLTSIAAQTSTAKLFHFLDKLLEIKKHLNSKIHLNMSLLWETLFIEWSKEPC